ncbi:MAG: carboxypeptidase-like regulatory domain-containing protein [Ignavibacteriae bacterium]|nr:MAG: carboxypeptidase-like regulatory domain-containing protein [Ignavibacteriota bacterium]
MHFILKLNYLVLLLPVLMFSQTHKIRGYVFDDSTHQALPFASIRVLHSDFVSTTNKEGQFVFDIPSGHDSLLVSYVGYQSSSILRPTTGDSLIRVGLRPAFIQMPDYFIIAHEEDPALAMMREAIKRRKSNYAGLKNYEITGYKRNILYSAGRIAMIDEQLVRQIYEGGSISKDFILSTHKTENIKNRSVPVNMNICASLFFIQDNATVRIGNNGSNIIFPLADNAMQYYDFKLLNTKNTGKEISHTIQIIPRLTIVPLIKGKIILDDATYAIIGADIESNEGWIFPLVKNFSMKIQQAYSNYNGFWIPQYSEFEMEGEISALGGLIHLDQMKISEVFSANSCKVNGAIPDSVKMARRSKFGGYTTDTSKAVTKLTRYRKTKRAPDPESRRFEPANKPPELTSATMDSLRPLPLTSIEKVAFAELDSSQTLDKVIKPKGPISVFTSSSSDTTRSFFQKLLKTVWNHGMLHHNRVEGVAPGAWFEFDEMDKEYFSNAELSYAFGLKTIEWKIGGGYYLGDDHLDRIEISGWNKIQPWQSSLAISKSINTGLFTLTGVDYFNYMRSAGWSAGVQKYFTDSLYAAISFTSERERSVSATLYHTIFNNTRRGNPAIQEGMNNTLRLQCGFDPGSTASLISQYRTRLTAAAEYSIPGLGSDFHYQKYSFLGSLRFNTFYSSLIMNPYVFVSAAGGAVSGEYGIQHLLTPAAALSFYAPSGVLKGVQPYDLIGDKYIMMQAEHNWQTLPFALLHLKQMEELGIQIITGGSIANIWNSSPYAERQNRWKPYWELYFGVSNLFDLFRIDAVHTSRHVNLIRLSISSMILD